MDTAKGLRPRGTYPKTTKFGRRVWENHKGKRLVASYVAHQLLHDPCEIFLGDGSSALWVMIAILKLNRNATILTNNLAIASEILYWPSRNVSVTLAQGELNTEYAAIYGPTAVSFCEDAAKDAQCVLPVTFLSFDRGPCAGEPSARRIKRAVVSFATELILICDSAKIGNPSGRRNLTRPILEQREWEKLRDREEGHHLVCDAAPVLASDFKYETAQFVDKKEQNWQVHLPQY